MTLRIVFWSVMLAMTIGSFYAVGCAGKGLGKDILKGREDQ